MEKQLLLHTSQFRFIDFTIHGFALTHVSRHLIVSLSLRIANYQWLEPPVAVGKQPVSTFPVTAASMLQVYS